MGFYIRKAISVGPFRFNLSKSGIGISAGVKGLRIGTGPSGNYIHMGRGGLYYRQTLPSGTENHQASQKNQSPRQTHAEVNHISLTEIESGDLTQLIDSSSSQLVKEMNEKRQKVRIWPFVAAIGLLFTYITNVNTQSTVAPVLVFLLASALTFLASIKDSLRKTTVLFFDMEPDVEALYQNLHDSFDNIAKSSSKWHVEAEGAIRDRKRNAGASSAIKRTSISIKKSSPPYVKANIDIPAIPVGKQTLYFFPDKILVYEANAVGAVSYENLTISVEPTRFIESGQLPKDALVVGKTWRYVNKQGGPDKRFKDNKELPIALYEDISFKSNTGLNERIEISRTEVGEGFATSISELARLK